MGQTIRVFEIIQILRANGRLVTNEQLSDRIDVSPRTIYRDIATLQSMRTLVEGSAGFGLNTTALIICYNLAVLPQIWRQA